MFSRSWLRKLPVRFKRNHNEKSAPLQEQLIAAAKAKRERRARERFHNYTASIRNNPCLRGAA